MSTPTFTPSPQLEAANENPGGATHIDVPPSAFVTVMAKAYVAQARAVERLA